MHQQDLSIPSILSILNIEALNEMQQAALKATEGHNNVMILWQTGLDKILLFYSLLTARGLLSKPFELYQTR